MGVSRQQAAENRSAIVAAAERLFRVRGVDAVGLTELMKEAGFTQGGFYNHFKSKDALVAEVMEKAMHDRADSPNAGSLDAQVAAYLSPAHRDNLEAGCPLSGFAGDAPRLTETARACYAHGLAAYLDRLERMVATDGATSEHTRRDALAVFSQMVGALVLSRAIAGSDPALADEILDAGRDALTGRRGDPVTSA
ncbi:MULTISPECIES: TetR/AcrR family transcriptional regulator [Burkholderia]|jgi:TetR/AcrR family transcriptional regulator, transcriptional repressor for nem operon|uniref:TetR family transcriptional regulator n=1 Tax=Burkholderia cenocepacia TaxID=95486 RepID=A0A142P9B0_9BURK|nr:MULTISPECIES: TetR family transcriptional regulator [Burkholderia]MDP9546102.1 TetR/AcrR family transcriptional repressor of nem operon [Burkholderia cepacia]ALV58250.1 TetR family transcriptional regulator [Burkholderia cenocepacia]AMU12603.1 TetR family transcriptional regulator [Burkholderia cenocepacia]AOK39226.1 TetR family transcriptional regulator [Burkholderia cenocepacia]AQQ21890.1 TetR family transcriptional regulator [Burkholderia cenocepacia]